MQMSGITIERKQREREGEREGRKGEKEREGGHVQLHTHIV